MEISSFRQFFASRMAWQEMNVHSNKCSHTSFEATYRDSQQFQLQPSGPSGLGNVRRVFCHPNHVQSKIISSDVFFSMA